jgi:ATP/maltotriose-dependent transcriptional regulator MalT
MFKLIDSKLRPPDLRPSLIKREHLVERLRSNLPLSATFICAGPGWGKTTLAADFIRGAGRSSIWYHLDSSDADIAVFFKYMVYAIRRHVAGFGQNTLDVTSSGTNIRPDQMADLFLYELSEQVAGETVIVLDNIHHIFEAEWSAPLFYRLLELLPEYIHFVLLARSAPAFAFSRMRSKQIMDRIDDRALSFTRGEAHDLFRGVIDDPASVDILLDRTQGWVGGLQIIRQALEADHRLRRQKIEEIIAEAEAEIFGYFAEKVYRSKRPETRSLLALASLPERITAEVVREGLALDVSDEQLALIVRENIFLSRVAGEADTYIFHPLFRDFLRRQLEEERNQQQRAAIRGRLADYYAAREEWGLALENFFEAGDESGAARALLSAGRQMIAGGLTLAAGKYFPRFREETLDRHPQLYNLMGDIRVIEGDSVSAEAMFRAALRASRGLNDRAVRAAAYAGLAHVAARNHNFKDAIRQARAAWFLVPEDATSLSARIKNVTGAALAFEGRYTEANNLMEEALRLAHEAGDARLVRTISHNLALPAYMEGDFRRAIRYFSRSPISHNESSRLHPDSIALYLNRAAVYTARGDLNLAARDLDRAEDIATFFNLRGYVPSILESRGNLARERREFDEADAFYNGALNEYRRVDADPVETDLYYERALLELRRGEIDQALELISLMISDRQEHGRDIEESLARQMRGRILLERSAERAIADIDSSEPLLRRLQCNYYLAIGCYLRARALADRDTEGGRRALVEFFSLADRFDYSYFIEVEESYRPALDDLCRRYSVTSEWTRKMNRED